MDQTAVEQVQSTWELVKAGAPEAADLFYGHLFTKDPSLRALFKGDMTEQGTKLVQMIGVAVSKLNDLDTLIPVLQGLGARHGDYGVEASHYDTVGAALLETLEQGLGAAFTPEVRQAWTTVYGTMATVMIEASGADGESSGTR